MSRKVVSTIFVLLSAYSVFAQKVTVIGKVIDSYSKQELGGAVLKVGPDRFVTNNKGDFSIDVDPKSLTEYGLTVSRSGYTPVQLKTVDADKFQLVEMKSGNNLEDVTVAITPRMIIERAAKNIPQNYYCNDYNLIAFQRTYDMVNDTMYFLKDDAILKVYVPSTGEAVQVGVVQNRDSIKEFIDPENPKRLLGKVSWKGSYTIPAWPGSIIRCKSPAPSKKAVTLNDLTYTFRKTILHNGRRTYVIDSRMTDSTREGANGTFLIDCETYAFVRHSEFANKPSIARMNRKNRMTDFFRYIQVDFALDTIIHKWFLKNIHVEARGLRRGRIEKYAATVADLVTLSVDTTNAVVDIPKNELARNSDILLKIRKPAPAEAWKSIDSIMNTAEYSKYMTDVMEPKLSVPPIN